MNTIRRWLTIACALMALICLVSAAPAAANSSNGNGMAGMDMSSTPIPFPTKPAKVLMVYLTLTEFHIDMKPAQPPIHVGEHVQFVIQNKGELPHELMIMDNSMSSMKGMSMKQMDAMSVSTVEVDQLQPGMTVTDNVVFKNAGTFEVACHLPGHEAMKTTITVVK